MMDVLLVLEPDAELDADAGERLTRQLRAELAELDIESIGAPAGRDAPDGAKGADPVTLGAIVMAMSASGGVFNSVVETLRDWLGRHARRHRISVTIDGDTIELERASAEQEQQLVEAYVRRHCVG
jgi:hypothetical protein